MRAKYRPDKNSGLVVVLYTKTVVWNGINVNVKFTYARADNSLQICYAKIVGADGRQVSKIKSDMLSEFRIAVYDELMSVVF